MQRLKRLSSTFQPRESSCKPAKTRKHSPFSFRIDDRPPFVVGGHQFPVCSLLETCKVASEVGSEQRITKSGPDRRFQIICRIIHVFDSFSLTMGIFYW